MEKSLLIASENPTGELSLAFKRALKFLTDEKYKIEKVSYEFDWKKPPGSQDILLILDVNPQDFSYTSGVGFLRKFWAAGLKQKLPPTILLSFDTPQKLFQRDERHVVTLLEGVEHITLPAKLGDIIEKIENSPARPDVETAKKYLKISCELGFERRIEHARSNFIGPYSLMVGARCTDNITQDDFNKIITSLKTREDRDELIIFNAVSISGQDLKSSNIKDYEIEKLFKNPLSKILKGKKILLIDDECKTAGWGETLKAIFGPYVTLDSIGKENTKDTKWKEWADVDNNSDMNSKLAAHPDKGLIDYDLILLDLYLTDEDNEKKGDGSKPFYKYSGLQLLEKIRKQDQSVPVILFTASSKAFNVKAAEEIGIDGYFQKGGRYHNEDEAVRYYAEFRNLIEKSTSQERMALREVWTVIEHSDEKDEVIKLLKEARKLLHIGFKESSIINMGMACELILEKPEMAVIKEGFKPDKVYATLIKADNDNSIKKYLLSAYFVYLFRSFIVHNSGYATFADALLAFRLALSCQSHC